MQDKRMVTRLHRYTWVPIYYTEHTENGRLSIILRVKAQKDILYNNMYNEDVSK